MTVVHMHAHARTHIHTKCSRPQLNRVTAPPNRYSLYILYSARWKGKMTNVSVIKPILSRRHNNKVIEILMVQVPILLFSPVHFWITETSPSSKLQCRYRLTSVQCQLRPHFSAHKWYWICLLFLLFPYQQETWNLLLQCTFLKT